MSSVDDFAQFVSEELAKDGESVLVVLAPNPSSDTEEAVWIAQAKGAVETTEGVTLSAALNKMSQSLDYTTKDLRVSDRASVLCALAKEAARWDSTVTLIPPKHQPLWTIKVSRVGYGFTAISMREAILIALDYLIDLGTP